MNTKTIELTGKESAALYHIKNYLSQNGDLPSIRDLMKAMEYKSPRSAAILINSLVNKKILHRNKDGSIRIINILPEKKDHAQTIDVPLVGSAACGIPLLAEQNIEAMIQVSLTLANLGNRYFLLRAQGDSMNRSGIKDGDLVLVKQQTHADNGDRVVALIDDEATIKEFWTDNDVIILKPRSSNKKHRPIIVSENFQIQGVVTAVIPNIFGK